MVVSLGAYFWHGYQVQRNAAVFLNRAAEHETAEEYGKAAEDVFRYLKLSPDDVEAQIRLAKYFGKSAKSQAEKSRAAQLFARAISLAPDERELRREHMALLLELGDYSTALVRSDELLKEDLEDDAALRVRALALYARWRLNSEGTLSDVVDSLVKANSARPSDLDLAIELAQIYRTELQDPPEAEREQLADAVMDRLVTSSPRKTEAYLGRHSYRRKFELAGADDDLQQAADADVKGADPAVQMTLGSRALETEKWPAAIEAFEHLIAAQPTNARGYLGLAQAQTGQGNNDLAAKALQNGLQQAGSDNVELQMRVIYDHIQAGRVGEAQKALDALEPQIAKMLGRGQAELLSRLHLLQARTKLAAKDYPSAIQRLKQVLALGRAETDSAEQVAFKAQVYAELGNCYRALRQWDQAATAIQQAAELQPKLATLRLDAARAWEAAGRLDEAVRQFDIATTLEGAPAAGWIEYCTALFRQQAVLPPEKRNWQLFARAIPKAREAGADDLSLGIIEAEYEAVRGHLDVAIPMLRRLEPQLLAQPEMAGRLLFDFERLGQTADADRVLAKLKSQKPTIGPVQLLLLEVDLLVGRKQLDKAQQALEAALRGQISDDERRAVTHRLVSLYLTQGDRVRARTLLADLAKGTSTDLRSLELLVELAFDANDANDAEQWQRQLREREGQDGTIWRFYRGQNVLRAAAKETNQQAVAGLLGEAQQLQEEIERLRPAWAPGYVLKAQLYQTPSKKNDNLAIDAYTQAVRLGQDRPGILEPLIFLLYRNRRFDEAATHLDRLRGNANLSPELAVLAMAIDASAGRFSQAIETARREVARDPKNAQSHVQLGQLLAMQPPAAEGDRKPSLAEAEAELKLATELAPQETTAWLSLLAFYADAKRPEEAKALLAGLRKTSTFSDEDRGLFFAHAYSMLGETEQADAAFREAVVTAPKRVDAQLDAARFFAARDPKLAEKCARQVMQLDPTNIFAPRLVAILSTEQGGNPKELEQIWNSMLDGQGADDQADKTNRRLKALFMLRRGGSEYRRLAEKSLESLVADGGQVAPIDRLILAGLYDAEGQTDAAREQLQALINQEKPDPTHLATYIDLLLRTSRGKEAGPILEQLAAIEPETRYSRTMGLKVRWLKDQKQEPQIQELLESFLKKNLADSTSDAEKARMLLYVAGMCAASDLPKPAEKGYRLAMKLEPAMFAEYAQWLARQGRMHEAIEICLQNEKSDKTVRPAMTLSSLLISGKATAEEMRSADPVLIRAVEEHGDQPGLLMTVGTLRLLQGNSDEAARLLKRTVELDPRNLDALNNLAMLLSNDPKTQDQAVAYIDRALEIAGSAPELLDSKGWILLKQRKLGEAESLFIEALALPPGDPRHRFHLALVYKLQGKLPEARQSIEKAREDRLDVGLLSPEERSELTKLEEALP